MKCTVSISSNKEMICSESSKKKTTKKISYTYQCEACNEIFNSKPGIDAHILQNHSSIDYNQNFTIEGKCKTCIITDHPNKSSIFNGESSRAVHFAVDARREKEHRRPSQNDYMRLYDGLVIRTPRSPSAAADAPTPSPFVKEEKTITPYYDNETISDISEEDMSIGQQEEQKQQEEEQKQQQGENIGDREKYYSTLRENYMNASSHFHNTIYNMRCERFQQEVSNVIFIDPDDYIERVKIIRSCIFEA